MCLIKSKTSTPVVPKSVEKDKVVRHQADASLTKTSVESSQSNYNQATRTFPIGLSDEIVTGKKTLLGE